MRSGGLGSVPWEAEVPATETCLYIAPYECMYVCMCDRTLWAPVGISGGQMKRLSIGVEIVGLPGSVVIPYVCMYVYMFDVCMYDKMIR